MTTFVFGYGSLLRRPGGIPCHLLGHRRAWNVAMDNRRTIPGYKSTSTRTRASAAGPRDVPEPLPAAEGRVNGVAFPSARRS